VPGPCVLCRIQCCRSLLIEIVKARIAQPFCLQLQTGIVDKQAAAITTYGAAQAGGRR
jgi:hypothetical protein